jgi:hypothetical protein
VILKKINQISQNEILLQKILSEANSKSKKELEKLEKEKVILNLRISELKTRGKILVDKLLEMGEEYSRFIREEFKREREKELKELEGQLSQIKTKIEQSRNYLINKGVVKEAFQYFNKIFNDLNPREKKYLLRLLIKEVIFTKERVLIDFFEVPSVEEIIKSSPDPVSLHQRIEWLPDKTSNNKLDLFQLAFMKDDAEKLPYALVDEFSFGIITVARGQKHLLSEEELKALQDSKEKRLHPPRIQTLLKTARKLQKILDSQSETCRAKLAEQLNITRARITQILNLLNLAPEIQDYIMSMPPVDGRSPISERALRPLTSITSHKEQLKVFKNLINNNYT